jgi:hypothetical protein
MSSTLYEDERIKEGVRKLRQRLEVEDHTPTAAIDDLITQL